MKKLIVMLLALLFYLPVFAFAEETASFYDPVFEQKFREQIARPEGNIYTSDCEYLTELHLGNATFPEEERFAVREEDKIHSLEDLDKFPNLVFIDFANNAVSDLAPLAQLSELQMIEGPANNITDISPIANLSNLFHVVFWENHISNIDAMKNLEELQVVSFFCNQITDISALAHKTKITILELHGNPIKDYSPVYPVLEQLEYMDCDYYGTTDENTGGQQQETQFDDQTELPDTADTITANADTRIDVSSVPDTALVFDDPMFEKALRDAMGIYNRPITQKDAYAVRKIGIFNDKSEGSQFSNIAPLAYFVNLEQLNFNSNLISDLSPLASLEKLQILYIAYNQIHDISPLENLNNLTELHLQYNQITDISALSGLTNLLVLNLEENRIESALPLAELTRLEIIKIKLSNVDREGIIALMRFPNLHEVSITMADYE